MSHYSHQPVKSGFEMLRRQARGRHSDKIMFGAAEAWELKQGLPLWEYLT